jgi:hypothetical protein
MIEVKYGPNHDEQKGWYNPSGWRKLKMVMVVVHLLLFETHKIEPVKDTKLYITAEKVYQKYNHLFFNAILSVYI